MTSSKCTLLFFLLALHSAIGQTTPTFGSFKPERGFLPTGSYALSDIESVDESSGSLTLHIPTASLPSGRGGFKHGIDLYYNSNLYDLTTDFASAGNVLDCQGNSTNCPQNVSALRSPEEAGWHYSYSYKLELENRPSGGRSVCNTNDLSTFYLVRHNLVLPDGSSHLLRLQSSSDGDGLGYYRHNDDGSVACPGTNVQPLSYPLNYYTTDGTFIRLSVSANSWKAIFPDGRTVSGSGRAGDANQICDRNGNCVAIQNGVDSTDPANPFAYTDIADDVGRKVRLHYHVNTCARPPYCNASQDDIEQPAYGGSGTLTWQVLYSPASVGTASAPAQYLCTSPTTGSSYTCLFQGSVRTISQVILPNGSGNLKYQFTYADNGAPAGSQGWGELRHIDFPNGVASEAGTPTVDYKYLFRPEIGGRIRDGQFMAKNPLVSKTVTRKETIEGSTTTVTEGWTFSFPIPELAMCDGTITGPDHGIKAISVLGCTGGSGFGRGLVWKEVSPLGAKTIRYWDINEPYIGTSANFDRKNAYVRAEYRSAANSGTYAATQFQYDKNGNVTSQTAFDYGVSTGTNFGNAPPSSDPIGTVLRKVDTSYYVSAAAGTTAPTQADTSAYWWNFSGQYNAAKMRTTVSDSTARSAVEFKYDNQATTANVTQQSQWDSTRASTLPTATRPPSLSGTDSIITLFAWSQGNLIDRTDPLGDVAASTTGGDLTQYNYAALPGCGGNVTNLFPTSVVLHQTVAADAITTNNTFDCTSGLLTSQTLVSGSTAKNLVTTAAYDNFGRLIQSTDTVGSSSSPVRQANTAYDDLNRKVQVSRPLDTAADNGLIEVSEFDQLGQLSRRMATDERGSPGLSSAAGTATETASRYFNGGRYVLDSIPFQLNSPPGGVTQPVRGWTVKTYDTDGRVNSEGAYQGNALPCTWTADPPTCPATDNTRISQKLYGYSANTVTITDAAGKTSMQTYDGLGRLSGVSAGGFQTIYQYNALDLLTSVTQTDNTTYGSAKTQTRTFAYDSLGRLLQTTQPEMNAVSYSYYLDGSLKTKTVASGPVIAMAYDSKKRVASKSYPGGSGEGVTYCYDGKVYDPAAGCKMLTGRSSDGSDFPDNRLTGVGAPTGWTNYSRIDALGRTLQLDQGVAGLGTESFLYSFNTNGSVKSIEYPSGRTVTYEIGGAGRPVSATGLLSGASTVYGQNIAYGPQGTLLQMKLAGGAVTENRQYTPLLQMSQISAVNGGTPLLALTLDYAGSGNNGNVWSQTVNTGAAIYTQKFDYDGLNRLSVAAENAAGTVNAQQTCAQMGGVWCVKYSYDGFGNAWTADKTGIAAGLKASTSSWYLVGNQVTNRMSGVAYDTAGNQTQIETANAARAAAYDGEGRIAQVADSGTAVAQYGYNGLGQRVKKTVGAAVTNYLYGAEGELLAEYGPASAGAGPQYLLTDHLGTTRAVLDSTGAIVSRHDFEPFGGELTRSGGGYSVADGVSIKFTGKERDAELAGSASQGLDYFGARFMSSGQGRFTSPDPIMVSKERLADPQRLNLYAYTRNNPLRYVDPNGEDLVIYTFYSNDLTDEQRKYLQANMKQIQAEIKQKYKDAGVDKFEFRDGNSLSHKQIGKILDMGRSTDTTGIGLLNFANKSFSGSNSTEGMLGATSTDSRSVVFMGQVAHGLNSDDISTLTFRMGEVASHELGHGQGFESDGSFLNFFKELVGRGNLMGEGQGLPKQPKVFDTTQDKTQRAIKEINRIGDNTPRQ